MSLYDVIFVCGSVLLLTYAFFVYKQNKWIRRGIPFSDVHPIFGNIKDVVLGRKIMKRAIIDFYLKHKNKPFIAFFSFHEPMVMVNDMDLVKSVLITDFNAFADRNFQASPSDPLEYHSMFALKGQPWRNLRTKLTPTFTTGKIKKMFDLIDACGKNLVECLRREAGKNGEVNIKEFCSRYTIDVIASSAFGIEGDALKDPNSNFGHMMRKAVSPNFIQQIVATIVFFSPWLLEKLQLSFTSDDVTEFFRKTVWGAVEYREKNNIVRNDFLHLMMQIRKMGRLNNDDEDDDGEVHEEVGEKIDLDGDKFVAQSYLFLTAGFDTSSSLMTYALYEMALNTEVQKKVYEEIHNVLAKHDGKITYDSVQEMTYLHMVTQETLRKYPALVMLDRRVTRSYRLPGTGIDLSPGDSVMIPVVGIHYDPDIYPEPNRFDPERFSEENRRERPSCTFLGFGDGPRHCIGMRMGYLQSKVGLIYTLLQYEVTPTSTPPIPLQFKNGVFLQVKGEIPLRLKLRSS